MKNKIKIFKTYLPYFFIYLYNLLLLFLHSVICLFIFTFTIDKVFSPFFYILFIASKKRVSKHTFLIVIDYFVCVMRQTQGRMKIKEKQTTDCGTRDKCCIMFFIFINGPQIAFDANSIPFCISQLTF